jgi:signal transduction histidine kinase
VVARVITRHHGDIGATGEVGAGARFWWTLPERQAVKAWQ